MDPVLTVWQAGDVPVLWTDLIGAWFEREFAAPINHTAPPGWRVLVTAGEDLIGHASIVLREADVGGSPLLLAGIGAVIMQPGWRGRGLGKALVRRAVEHSRDHTPAAFGHLICEDHRLTFYQSLGWQKVPGPMFFTSWQGVREEARRHHILIMPLREGLTWPPGVIDLRGLAW